MGSGWNGERAGSGLGREGVVPDCTGMCGIISPFLLPYSLQTYASEIAGVGLGKPTGEAEAHPKERE